MHDSEAFGNYLSGFTDGEGTFVLVMQKQYGREHPRAIFQIILRADDAPILEIIQSYWKCGSIYYHERKGRTAKCPVWRTVHYVVYRPDDLAEIVVPHFERFPLLAKKSRDFSIWKQAVAITAAVKARRQQGGKGSGPAVKWTDQEREKFSELMRELSQVRAFKDPTSQSASAGPRTTADLNSRKPRRSAP